MDSVETSSETIPCRYCYLPVHPAATKCPHCHESLLKRSRVEVARKRIITVVGIGTALLSLFYGLKEGYFYIEQRQQERAMFAAYMVAAENFINADNLEYAEISLNDALALNPNDLELRLRYFLLRARNIQREMDFTESRLPGQYQAKMPALITNGFSLVDSHFPADKQARLLSNLARLLRVDRSWQKPDAIDKLFLRARALAPDDADIAYWYGVRLIASGVDKERGFALIRQAMEMAPDNAIYVTAMGRYQIKAGDYSAAFSSFRRAIELRPQQQELQRIRASNMASSFLRRALRDADSIADISGENFFGMSLQQRVDLLDFTLDGMGNVGDARMIKLLAAKLFHAAQQDARAEDLLRDVVGEYDKKFTDKSELELLAAVLEAQGKVEAEKVRALLENGR